jgi:hypothetical protein
MKGPLLFLLLVVNSNVSAQLPPIPRSEDGQYGRNCGWEGANPADRDWMDSFISKRDTATIVDWLRNGTKVRQVYATDALLLLSSRDLIR